jgi:hypothetical protein
MWCSKPHPRDKIVVENAGVQQGGSKFRTSSGANASSKPNASSPIDYYELTSTPGHASIVWLLLNQQNPCPP